MFGYKVRDKIALVTGASGFVGKNLVNRLLHDGWNLILLVRNPEKLDELTKNKCRIIMGDITDANIVLEAVKDVSVIFHCAANVSTWDNWEAYYKVNVLGVENLVKAVKQNNPNLYRILHISTVDVYGFPDAPCDENSSIKTEANYGYGKSKALGEMLLRKYCDENNISYTVFRPTNIIGVGSQFIERIGAELKAGLMLKINGGSLDGGFLYVENLIDYMLWAVKSKKSLGECYNICDNNNASWREFIDYFKQKIKGKGVVINLPYKLAMFVATLCEYVYKIFAPKKEPFLHSLLIVMFGKTCGHRADKIRLHSEFSSRVDFKEAMDCSIKWFEEKIGG